MRLAVALEHRPMAFEDQPKCFCPGRIVARDVPGCFEYADKGLVDKVKPIVLRKADDQFPVLKAGQILHERADVIQAAAPEDEGLCTNNVSEKDAPRQVAMFDSDARARDVNDGSVRYALESAVDDVDRFTAVSKRGHLSFELPWQPLVIAILKPYERPTSGRNAAIPRRRRPPIVCQSEVSKSLVSEPLNHGRRVIRGCIVDNDQFKILVALRQHAVDGAGQHLRSVVGRHDHRDVRC